MMIPGQYRDRGIVKTLAHAYAFLTYVIHNVSVSLPQGGRRPRLDVYRA